MRKQSDAGDLRRTVTALVGRECWDAYMPDGVELCLEIGERRPVAGSARRVQLGAYGIIVGSSIWHVSEPLDIGGTINETGSDVSRQLQLLLGTISSADVSRNFDLRIEVSSRAVLTVAPEKTNFDIPGWELFTPNGSLFKVTSGGVLRIDATR